MIAATFAGATRAAGAATAAGATTVRTTNGSSENSEAKPPLVQPKLIWLNKVYFALKKFIGDANIKICCLSGSGTSYIF